VSNKRLDALRDLLRRFVLPDAHHHPASAFQLAGRVEVSLTVLLELRLPVPRVDTRLIAMLRAPMPKAAIHEHGDLRSGEHDVSHTTQSGQWATVNQVTQPPGV